MKIPFPIRRPALLASNLRTNREEPPLETIARIQDSGEFMWSNLPHAARSFSACILFLPYDQARAAAVGYLYARILDTYEDLHVDRTSRETILRSFFDRFESDTLTPAPCLQTKDPLNTRDSMHVLLVEHCHKIDAVYRTLNPEYQQAVKTLCKQTGAGMAQASSWFDQQDGVLANEEQLVSYCDFVLGNPVHFALHIMQGHAPQNHQSATAFQVGRFVQLANITRDLEEDLDRGISYSPLLDPKDLHGPEAQELRVTSVRTARRSITLLALNYAPAYVAMVEELQFPRWSMARGASVLMMLFTARYWMKCTQQCGLHPQQRSKTTLRLFLQAGLCVFSRKKGQRTLRDAEQTLSRIIQESN
ncbi:MAG: squalene/phytoene synthase family protein [Planctomycetes bacterium]|nr:squalene/phytoene synthase family protein [Planctomycetota bacterium]